MSDSKVLAANIKASRVKAGFKSSDMADQLGVSKSYYSQLENGHRELTVTRMLAIADLLRIDPAELLYKVKHCPECGQIVEGLV